MISKNDIRMKTSLVSILFPVLLLFCLPACTADDEPTPAINELDCSIDPTACDLASANRAFGFSLFQRLQAETPTENIFVSPYSISTVLGMTAHGARAQTETAMLQALRLDNWAPGSVEAAQQTVIEQLPQVDPGVDLTLANSIWHRNDFPIDADFKATAQEAYAAEVNPLDFSDPEAPTLINNWVNDQTEGTISEIVDQIPREAVMYLINAIYFKANWRYAFDADKTTDAPFTLADGTTKEVPMMNHGEIKLPYADGDTYSRVDLPYADSTFSMSLFLPRPDRTTVEVISELSDADWDALNESLHPTTVYFRMPKFELEWENLLNEVLSDEGMSVAFSDNADFSGLGSDGLKISKVKHKSFISVDEAGTEASAVTSVEIVNTSLPSYPNLNFNRPFVLLIRDHATNQPLFLGQIMEP